jgi:hypothetical protein
MVTSTTFSQDLLTVWEEYRRAAKHSRQLKSNVNRSRLQGLVLVIGGAVLGVLANQASRWSDPAGWTPIALALASAIAFAIAAAISRHVLDSQSERQWVLARSQAEALKSEAYTYLVQAPPYDGEDRDAKLAEKTEKILGDLMHPIVLTNEEKREKFPAKWLSMDDYIAKRVNEQIYNFYEPRVQEYTGTLNRIKNTGLWLAIAGAVLGAVATVTNTAWPAAWVAVIGTISGSLAAFTFAGRYQYLIESYSLTARRLLWLRNGWDRLSDEQKAIQAGHFVKQFEGTISIENKNWIATWTKETEDESSPQINTAT